MTPDESKRFHVRVAVAFRIHGLTNDLVELQKTDARFRPEALALEVVRVAKERHDEDGKRELETVHRRVIDRHAMPKESSEIVDDDRPPERYQHGPARMARFAEAVRLLNHVLTPSTWIAEHAANSYEGTREGVVEFVVSNTMIVLRDYSEHWPGGTDEATIADAVTAAVLDQPPKALVAEVLRAWGASKKTVSSALAVTRRQK